MIYVGEVQIRLGGHMTLVYTEGWEVRAEWVPGAVISRRRYNNKYELRTFIAACLEQFNEMEVCIFPDISDYE